MKADNCSPVSHLRLIATVSWREGKIPNLSATRDVSHLQYCLKGLLERDVISEFVSLSLS